MTNFLNFLYFSSGTIGGSFTGLTIRSKDIELRLLNAKKIKLEKTYWQLINLIFPLILIFIIGLILSIIRRRKYHA